MKFLSLVFSCLLLTACSHGRNMIDVENRIQAMEKKEYEEIRDDLRILIDRHPELTPSQRTTLKDQVLSGFDRHRLLREQERQLISLYLHTSLDPEEKNEVRKALKEKLEELYKSKARNIEEVVENVSAPLRTSRPALEFEQDFSTLMREFR